MADTESNNDVENFDGGLCWRKTARGSDESYRMNSRRRGVAVIFSQELFLNLLVNKHRGTEQDCQSLIKTFNGFGFEVELHKDLPLADIKDRLKELSERDHSDCDCFVLTFMCHGTDGRLSARDNIFEFHILWERFTDEACPSLANKPKIFIVQSCQGHGRLGHVNIYKEKKKLVEDQEYVQLMPSYQLPKGADFLVALSSTPGFVSWSSAVSGSWYVQALCRELDSHGYDHDMLTLLTTVNRIVATDHSYHDKENKMLRKQMPSFISLLMKRLKFTKKRKANKKKKCQYNCDTGSYEEEDGVSSRSLTKKLDDRGRIRKRSTSKISPTSAKN